MSRKVLVAFIAFLAVVSFAGTASALHMITGEVIAVNPSWQELTINVSGFPVTFTAIDRATMALANLKPGDMVEVATHSFLSDFSPVNYHEAGDWKAFAESITRLPAGG
ncbi:MAG: hypothetical protein F9K13_07575 [Candidatus Methylomirabilis oxygeniifera]|uniref:Uncharacterized protein n=1 Tax=Methylomirabilis oxygeniifera TaxID=671143 RepID=D5MLQ2_METO1|nr:MAG: hypothetical protein F9K13_07575 [Candidatus Methylomirabilis oxyfera]CBE69959.1 exported protein of unknown function [Candidatus Methylomirabilis oxyfera]